MKYKMILLSALLLPIAMYCNGNETHAARIKELEAIRFEKEVEIAQLSRKISEEAHPYCEYKAIALRFWNPSDKQDKAVSFDAFIIKLCEAFEAGEDTEVMCANVPLIKNESINSYLTILRVALQFLFIDRLTNRYKQLINELVVIIKELNYLKLK